MLDKSIVEFERKYFIRDLIPENIFTSFRVIEFEKFTTFLSLIKNADKFESRVLRIPIESRKELEIISKIMKETFLFNFCTIELIMSGDLFKDTIGNLLLEISNFKHSIIIRDIYDFSLRDLMKDKKNEWISKHPLFIEIEINYENYIMVLSKIPHLYANGQHRFFRLDWNYSSFNKMKMSELKSLEFWINHIISWIVTPITRQEVLTIEPVYGFYLSVFVSDEFMLYYNKRHFIESKNTYLLDMSNEDMGFKCLSRFTKYTDLTKEVMYFNWLPKRIDWSLLNFYDNEKIEKNINEIPEITLLVMQFMRRAF